MILTTKNVTFIKSQNLVVSAHQPWHIACFIREFNEKLSYNL